MTTPHTNSEEFNTMTDEELQAQLEAIEAELGRRKWAKVDDLMPRVEALTDEELAEFSNRVSTLKTARDRKVQEMTEGAKQPLDTAALIQRRTQEQRERFRQGKASNGISPYEGMSKEEVMKLLGGVS